MHKDIGIQQLKGQLLPSSKHGDVIFQMSQRVYFIQNTIG